jgi:hypothetical protein
MSQVRDPVVLPRFVRDRQPLAIGADRGALADLPVALRVGLVILRAAVPAVVGGLVVVPHHHHREALVEPLEIGVGPVGGVPQPIIGQAHHLGRRLDHPAGERSVRARIAAALIFVEIIAQVDHQVDVLARGGMGVGVEPAERQVGAGEDAEREALGGAGLAVRQRLGAARPASGDRRDP